MCKRLRLVWVRRFKYPLLLLILTVRLCVQNTDKQNTDNSHRHVVCAEHRQTEHRQFSPSGCVCRTQTNRTQTILTVMLCVQNTDKQNTDNSHRQVVCAEHKQNTDNSHCHFVRVEHSWAVTWTCPSAVPTTPCGNCSSRTERGTSTVCDTAACWSVGTDPSRLLWHQDGQTLTQWRTAHHTPTADRSKCAKLLLSPSSFIALCCSLCLAFFLSVLFVLSVLPLSFLSSLFSVFSSSLFSLSFCLLCFLCLVFFFVLSVLSSSLFPLSCLLCFLSCFLLCSLCLAFFSVFSVRLVFFLSVFFVLSVFLSSFLSSLLSLSCLLPFCLLCFLCLSFFLSVFFVLSVFLSSFLSSLFSLSFFLPFCLLCCLYLAFFLTGKVTQNSRSTWKETAQKTNANIKWSYTSSETLRFFVLSVFLLSFCVLSSLYWLLPSCHLCAFFSVLTCSALKRNKLIGTLLQGWLSSVLYA